MRKDLMLIGLLVVTLTLMAVPLSQSLIDVLLAINISFSVMLLMVAVYLKRPSDFSTFPSVILIGTSFRLALSIGTTRLILSEADAGNIVETFGNFVVAGSVAIGLVIFLIITVVQFLVITKGAERVAEVAARFALDALPGKQMTIDAEVRAGNIEAEEGSQQRALLDKDSQFFGAMDGAMKFVKGDAIAGLIIICINLVGGIIVGLTMHGLTFQESVGIFSLLTIGDGLVAQFPALLMSLCAGIMVTRTSNADSDDLGSDINDELINDLRAPVVTAGIVFGVGLIPGFPLLIFSSISVGLLVTAFLLRRAKRIADAELKEVITEEPENDTANQVAKLPSEDPETLKFSDRFVLSLSGLAIQAVDLKAIEQSLLSHFWTLYTRRGVRFPRPTIVELENHTDTITFSVSLDEVPVISIELVQGHSLLRVPDLQTYLSQHPESDLDELNTKALHGYWVPNDHIAQLSEIGVSVLTYEDVITFLTYRLYEQNVGILFSNEVMETLVESFKAADAATMALIEEDMSKPALLKMFRYLVEDGVPLRPASLVISSLHYWMNNSDNPTSLMLAECLRVAMKRQLCYSIAGKAGVIGMALLEPAIETAIRQGLAEVSQMAPDAARDGIFLDADLTDALLDQLEKLTQEHKDGAYQTTIIVSADIRRRLRNFMAANDLHLPVLAPHEVASEIPSFPIDVIKFDGLETMTREQETMS